MSKISLRKGITLFLLVFVVLPIAAQPLRPMLVGLLPEPTLWQSLSMFLSTGLIAGLAGYAWNLREKTKRLERQVEREKYREPTRGIER